MSRVLIGSLAVLLLGAGGVAAQPPGKVHPPPHAEPITDPVLVREIEIGEEEIPLHLLHHHVPNLKAGDEDQLHRLAHAHGGQEEGPWEGIPGGLVRDERVASQLWAGLHLVLG